LNHGGSRREAKMGVVKKMQKTAEATEAEKLVALGYTPEEAEAMIASLETKRADTERDQIKSLIREGKTVGEIATLYPSVSLWKAQDFVNLIWNKRGPKGTVAKKRGRVSKSEAEARVSQVMEATSGGSVSMKDLTSSLGDWARPLVGKLVKAGKIVGTGDNRSMVYTAA